MTTTATLTFGSSTPADYGATEHAVTVSAGGRTIAGSVLLTPDPINGGSAPSGDSLDCWIGEDLLTWIDGLAAGPREAVIGALRRLDAGDVDLTDG